VLPHWTLLSVSSSGRHHWQSLSLHHEAFASALAAHFEFLVHWLRCADPCPPERQPLDCSPIEAPTPGKTTFSWLLGGVGIWIPRVCSELLDVPLELLGLACAEIFLTGVLLDGLLEESCLGEESPEFLSGVLTAPALGLALGVPSPSSTAAGLCHSGVTALPAHGLALGVLGSSSGSVFEDCVVEDGSPEEP